MTKILIDTDEVYDADETATELNIGVATVWRWIKRAKLIAVKVGGRTLIPKSEIERLKNG